MLSPGGSTPLRELRYSRGERLYFRIFGVWPWRVVERRLLALEEGRAQFQRETRDWLRAAR